MARKVLHDKGGEVVCQKITFNHSTRVGKGPKTDLAILEQPLMKTVMLNAQNNILI